MHKEINFEASIEHDLTTAGGYSRGNPDEYDSDLALFPDEVVSFVQLSPSPEKNLQIRLAYMYMSYGDSNRDQKSLRGKNGLLAIFAPEFLYYTLSDRLNQLSVHASILREP